MDRYEWDEAKNRANRTKHGISFEEAIEIFKGDTFSLIDYRDDYGELREVTIGAIKGLIVLVVVHTERNGRVRIISARRASKKERKNYYEHITRAA
ncbi:MAG: BrnT family toxin [Caldilineaceae bacterium]|nr:BrnT family toxin [Caldilineaceae bacterium]